MRLIVFVLLAVWFLPACSTVQPYALRAVEERKAMNDGQAQLAVLGMCDVAIGAAVRVWSREELELAFLVCNPNRFPIDMTGLAAPGS